MNSNAFVESVLHECLTGAGYALRYAGAWHTVEGFEALSTMFGELVPQDQNGTLVREVCDRGGVIGGGRTMRYADSREGGHFHTDGAELPFPIPDLFALFCVRQAPTGGVLQLVHVDDVVARLSTKTLKVLHQPMKFDRRGNEEPGEPQSVDKPILFVEDGVTCVTYFRRYIEIAHERAQPMTTVQRRALDVLDGALSNCGAIRELKMRPGEVLFVHNKRFLHARTAFEDDPAAPRLLLRSWIRLGRPAK
jgi:hypothetical protein